MKATSLDLKDVILLEPHAFEDARGHFVERFNRERFREATGEQPDFVQHNQSRSRAGVVRGLHYQLAPAAQGKLVRVVSGSVFDVAVDIRRSSPDFGRWTGVMLSAENRRQLWIPPGFAHGFMALTEGAELLYCVTAPYAPALERSVRWDDPDIGVAWPRELDPNLSPKDAIAPLLKDATPFD